MRKICENCKIEYSTTDSRRKTCGKSCADARRKINWSHRKDLTLPTVGKSDLPAPEDLPAPYAKRVHDMWAALVGNGELPTRIA